MTKKQLSTELWARLLDDGALETRASRFGGGEALYFGTKEIAHWHKPGELDLRLTKKGQREHREAIEDDKRFHNQRASSDWIEFHLSKPVDIAAAEGWVKIALRYSRSK